MLFKIALDVGPCNAIMAVFFVTTSILKSKFLVFSETHSYILSAFEALGISRNFLLLIL